MKSSKYARAILAATRKADLDYSLIDNGDKIAVGISGGKDSLALLYTLHFYRYLSKKDFKLYPIYLDLGFPNSSSEGIKKYCSDLGYSLNVDDSRFVYEVLVSHQEEGKHLPCSICSRMKKAAINNLANKLGCNKVAFAHHADDVIETLWMNMIHSGKAATFAPKMELKRAGVTFIRPFYYVKEKQIIELTRDLELPVLKSPCPADKKTEREAIKNFLAHFYKEFPDARSNFSYLLNNYEMLDLPAFSLEYPLDDGYSYTPLSNIKQLDKLLKLPDPHKDTYIVHYQHKFDKDLSSQFSLDIVNPHRVYIEDIVLSSPQALEGLIKAIDDIITKMSKKTSPITFYLPRGKEYKKLRDSLGFRYELDRASLKHTWLLRRSFDI